MKTPIVRRLSVLLGTTVLIAGNVFAQSAGVLSSQQLTILVSGYEISNESLYLTSDPEINSKTLAAFATMFKGVSDAQWFERDSKLLVKFNKDGRQTTALFNKKGQHIYTIRYGSEKDLPAEARRMVKINYFDFDITHVIEVNSLGKTAWVVKLEDQKRIITVKVVDDEMEEIENFRKAK